MCRWDIEDIVKYKLFPSVLYIVYNVDYLYPRGSRGGIDAS